MIAMAISPTLFKSSSMHEQSPSKALITGIQSLFSSSCQLGVKTLSPSNPHYRPFYDTTLSYQRDIEVCGGYSYHNVGTTKIN